MARANATIPDELMQKIRDFAQKESRTEAAMIRLLLEYAVKEKTRKRKSNG